MDLFENEIVDKNKKILKKIIIAIISIIIICSIIIGVIIYLNSSALKVYIDQTGFSMDENTFINDNKVYISIKDVSKSLGYNYYNGEYGVISEDNTKGYIKNDNETVIFEANSNKLYKISAKDNTVSEYIYIDEPIKFMNEKLYISQEGFQSAFSALFNYKQNTINIYTLSYLNKYYTSRIANYGYKEISSDFNNQKAMISNMLVVKKEDGKMGIITTDGKEIIGAKYDNINYVETTKYFFVTNSNKVGLIDNKGSTKINLLYDNIKLLDKDLNLYIVENNNKKGVINDSGKILIYIEYDNIGIDTSLYKGNSIKNQYLLFDNCIPVKKDNKWGVINKNGNLIAKVEYDNIGCVVGTSNNKSVSNVVIIPDYEGIILKKNNSYGIINSIGENIVPFALETVYSVTESGVTKYKMENIGKVIDVEEYFKLKNIEKIDRNNTNSIQSNTINNSNIIEKNND